MYGLRSAEDLYVIYGFYDKVLYEDVGDGTLPCKNALSRSQIPSKPFNMVLHVTLLLFCASIN